MSLHLPDLIREIRYFWGGSATLDCSGLGFGTTALLVLISWVLGFFTGGLLAILIFSHNCREVLQFLLQVVLSYLPVQFRRRFLQGPWNSEPDCASIELVTEQSRSKRRRLSSCLGSCRSLLGTQGPALHEKLYPLLAPGPQPVQLATKVRQHHCVQHPLLRGGR